MSDPPPAPSPAERPLPRALPRQGILSEELVHRPDQPDVENPYWLGEEPDEHPDPSLGCIRRGLCCKSSPGWFAPGEVEQAAELLGLSPDAFVRHYAVVVSYELEGVEVPAFAPVKLGRDGKPLIKPATPADRLYYLFRGPCIFYEDAGCRIYAARPLECRQYVCTNPPDENPTHEAIARLWRDASAPAEPGHQGEEQPQQGQPGGDAQPG